MSGFNLARFNPFLYRSYIYDYETGLYYLQSRYYDPEIGRFINADEPVFTGNGHNNIHNAYAYCNDNPVNSIDPSGYIGYLFTLIDPWAFTISLTISLISLWAADGLIESLSSIPFGGYRRQTLDLPLDRIYDLANVTTIPYQENPVVPLTKVESPSISIARAQTIALADDKIRKAVHPRSHARYWTATIFVDYVDIGRPISRLVAIEEVRNGRNVFTVTKAEAEDVARYASSFSGKLDPIGPQIDKGKENTIGFYKHYHTHYHGTGHVFYLFEI